MWLLSSAAAAAADEPVNVTEAEAEPSLLLITVVPDAPPDPFGRSILSSSATAACVSNFF